MIEHGANPRAVESTIAAKRRARSAATKGSRATAGVLRCKPHNRPLAADGSGCQRCDQDADAEAGAIQGGWP